MRQFLYGACAVALAALTTGCGTYYERSYAYAPPGAVYYGDRYPTRSYYYPSTAYAYPRTYYVEPGWG